MLIGFCVYQRYAVCCISILMSWFCPSTDKAVGKVSSLQDRERRASTSSTMSTASQVGTPDTALKAVRVILLRFHFMHYLYIICFKYTWMLSQILIAIEKKNIVKILIKASHIILHILSENMNGYVNFIGICKGLKCKECKTFWCWSSIKTEICPCPQQYSSNHS